MPIKHKKTSTLVLALVCSGLFAASVFGQAQAAQPDKKCPPQELGFRPGPPPQEVNGMPPYLRGLKLTEQQEDKIFAILQAQAAPQYQKSKALKAAHEALQKLAQTGDFNPAAARTAADKLGQALADMTYLRLQTDSQIRALLSPEQRDILSKRPHPGPDDKRDHLHQMEPPALEHDLP